VSVTKRLKESLSFFLVIENVRRGEHLIYFVQYYRVIVPGPKSRFTFLDIVNIYICLFFLVLSIHNDLSTLEKNHVIFSVPCISRFIA